MGVTFVGAL